MRIRHCFTCILSVDSTYPVTGEGVLGELIVGLATLECLHGLHHLVPGSAF